MTIAEDAVKVNGKLTELDVLIKYELDAEIGMNLIVLLNLPKENNID